MEIWLLRHAAAQEGAVSGRDEDRALTPEAARQALAVGHGLAALEPGIDLILTSPYRRARETAESAARGLGLEKKLRESGALRPGRDPGEILDELAPEVCAGVLLVGHQPYLGTLLGRLLAGNDQMEIPLKKGAVAWVSMKSARAGELRALLPAEFLARLGRFGEEQGR